MVLLVASGDRKVLEEVRDLLPMAGYEVELLTEEKAANAVLRLLDRRVDVIVVDSDIEDLSGLAMVRIAKRLKPRVPVIVLTSDAPIETGQQILAEGIHYYLFKPCEPGRLKEVLLSAFALVERGRKKNARY
jgi:two-component system cell cycle sensor histidine kinase/response regulator CckA